MENLNLEIVDFIETSYEPLKKELGYIETTDWSLAEDLKGRELQHGVISTFTSRAIDTAKKLNTIAKLDMQNEHVKKVMSLCKRMFDHYEKIYLKYEKSHDWSSFVEAGKSLAEMQNEMTFQSNIRNDLNGFKMHIRNINFGDESEKVEVKTFNNIPLPLMRKESHY